MQDKKLSKNSLEFKKYFEGKRITKQGFGFLGRGANVVKFLLENGASVLVADMKSEKDLEQSTKEVGDFILDKYKVNIDNFLDKNGNKRVEYVFGKHRLQDFESVKISKSSKEIYGCDYVIQASGVPKDNIYLNHSKDEGVKVYQESSLFVEIIREFNNNLEKENSKDLEDEKIKIIGVTGTRGKTTTTFLIKKIIEDFLDKNNLDGGGYAAAKNENKKAKREVRFGGNVQGVATLENLKYIKEGDVIVMELDSWILQGFKDIDYSPDIAVFTNIMADHMNYYKNNMQEYFLDKANIFLYQKSSDVFISTENIMISMEKYLKEEEIKSFYELENTKIYLSEEKIQEINNNFKSNLLGAHNKINVALAVIACQKYGVDDETIKESLENFTGVPGRLELVRKVNNISFINDTCATTGDASIAALDSFATNNENKKIILITGGRDKELDMTNYINKIIDYKNKDIIKNIFILTDSTTTGSDILIKSFNEKGFTDYDMVLNLEHGVATARSAAEDGNVILFTPAFASFGMFQNEYDRGDKFNEIVNSLI